MTPLQTTLTGAHGIRCGLNRETIAIDLTDIPNDALTVAIKGDNGMGKSTILNLAMTPWRIPPCVGNIYDQFGEAGLRELVWSHDEIEYRSTIEYRNTGRTKSQKAFLHRRSALDSAWNPVSLPDHTVSDGKSSTYDACLTHILGDQEVYYLSAFRAQGAPKLAEYDNPKALMRALLNLDEPAQLAAKSKEVVRELRRELEGVQSQAQEIEKYPEEIEAIAGQITSLDDAIKARSASRNEAIETASTARAELDRAIAGDLDRQQTIKQREAVSARLRDAKAAELASINMAIKAAVAASGRLIAERSRFDNVRTNMQTDITSAQDRASRANLTLKNKDAIVAAETEMSTLEVNLAEREKAASGLGDQVQHLREIAGQVRVLEAKGANKITEGKAQATSLAALINRAEFVTAVPCRGEGVFASCPALKEAIAAGGMIDEVKDKVSSLRAEWHVIDDEIKALSAQVAGARDVDLSLQAANDIATALRKKLAEVRSIAASASALDVAEQNLAEANDSAEAMGARLKQAEAEHAESIAALQGEIAAAKAAKQKTEQDSAAAVSAVMAELDAIPEPGTDQAVTMARDKLHQAETAAQDAAAAMEKANADRAAMEVDIKRLKSALKSGSLILKKASKLEAEIADWYLLAKGLLGVIDLSIEDAGPSIAAIANDLLAVAYGPRFSLRIVTQREQANGKTVETFDVSVIDSDSGMESSILQKSGGEAVILDRCLTDAAALYQQDTTGINYETSFADEADGALSADNRRMFYEMERRAMEIGKYGRKFFVSHNPEAWDRADHVIDLAQYLEVV